MRPPRQFATSCSSSRWACTDVGTGLLPTLRWRELDSNLRSLSKPEILLPRYAQVIHIMQTYLGAGAAMVQPFFCGASNHSTEPGWGTV